MSLRPAIGHTWFDHYWPEVYLARDAVMLEGKFKKPPSFYDRLLRRVQPDLADEVAFRRYVESEQFLKDCTPERLLTREAVTLARLSLLESTL